LAVNKDVINPYPTYNKR